MGEGSKIQWTNHTFNMWRGCTKVSDGCRFCYAETMSKRNPKTLGVWGDNGTRAIAAESYWKMPVKWNRDAECNCGAAGRGGAECKWCADGRQRPRVFCASLADVCEDRHDVIEARLRLKQLIIDTPNLDWLLLTKRPENYLRLFWGPEWWPSNVWAGTSCEDQDHANKRVHHILRVPVAVRFLSLEPLLGPVNLQRLWWEHNGHSELSPNFAAWVGIHWVIVGSESGPRRRPMQTEWAESIQRQCDEAGVAFFMKQMEVDGKVTGEIERFPADLRVRQFPGATP